MRIRKVIRYGLIYGFQRTVVKIAGRSRKLYLRFFFGKLLFSQKRDTSLIGCGQFGFSTISFFILKRNGNRFLECFDINKENEISTAAFWGYQSQPDIVRLIANPECKYIYIASNHASHANYAILGLKAGKTIYAEKPLAVNYEQFRTLLEFQRSTQDDNRLFVGYNRPFSQAIYELRKYIRNSGLPITFNCFVIGHVIEQTHWYRMPEEGTRICGNVGHWIDLLINLLNIRGKISKYYNISIAYSNYDEIDDNISISITTENHDLCNIIISSRSEPFEGINESIQFQSGEIIAKIDDFRKMQIWKGSDKFLYSYKPKDVGHAQAISQPFSIDYRRNFQEIEISTVIMLEIADMVKRRQTSKEIYPFSIIENLLSITHA